MKLQGIWNLKKIAMRNLMRHKVKTFLTAAAIMVSVGLFIFLNCWIVGSSIDSQRNIVNYEMGAAKLQTRLYFEKNEEIPSFENFKDWEIYHRALDKEGYDSAPRYVFAGTLFSTVGSIPVLFHGVDPELEARTMRFPEYIEKRANDKWTGFGRWVQDNGEFEIALGRMAAERLRVGIPTRPLRSELEDVIKQITNNLADADFIRSLYEEAQRKGVWDANENLMEGNERLVLKNDASKADLERYWDMVAASGRNDLRINATIDMKAVPETIRADKWEGELMPALRSEDVRLVESAYEYVDVLGGYLLKEDFDENQLDLVLDAMIRADYSGAVRNVFQVFDVKVVGIVNSPAPLPNGNTAYIPLGVLQDEAGMMLEGAVTELVIRQKGATLYQLPGASESAEAISSALERGLASLGRDMPDDLVVNTWQAYMADYLSFEQTETMMTNVIVFLLLFIAFLGISNTILLAILERTKETGMMRAMGMTNGQMIMVYMLEAGFIGLIGSILGIALGCAINYPMVEFGMDFSDMEALMGGGGLGFRVTGSFYSTWLFPVIIGSGIGATILSALAAILPTRKALKMPITDAMRFE